MPAPLVEMAGVSKSYGGVPALSAVDWHCEAGTIQAILGENGAGKSTLMKLLSGVIQPDAGTLSIEGRPVVLASPGDAVERGIVCMFQELSLMPHLSVGDNMVLAAPKTRFGVLQRSAWQAAREALDRVGADHIPLAARISLLTLAERQLVEIAKAILRRPRLLILDEATSALTSELVRKVFRVVRELRDQGTAVLFISHRMYEVDELADTISVFRNGRHIDTFAAGRHTHDEIIGMMIGQPLAELFPPPPPPVTNDNEPVLSARNIRWNGQLDGIDLEVRPGEIIGLGGLDGQGQQQIMHALYGVLNGMQGEVRVAGRKIARPSPSRMKRRAIGMALVPEDRKTEGLITAMSIADNLRLPSLGRVPLGLLGPGLALDRTLAGLIERLALSYRHLTDPVDTLSGGNQQKVVLAKWLALSPRCLLLMDPTRGIDVKTKAQIYHLLHDLAREGLAIILQSTDYEELINLCNRVYVFYCGRINRQLSGATLTADALLAASMNLPPPAAEISP